MKSSELIKEVEAAGWVLVRVKGSHHQFIPVVLEAAALLTAPFRPSHIG
ncbi:type II toxin-antitoxin system HicA family toxin [Rheinheimera sp.]